MTESPAPKRPAAVILPIFDTPPFEVLFIERAAHLRRHAGQMAFPGGAVETSDASHLAAALREMHEEVGIAPNFVDVIDELPTLVQQRNVFAVSSFVAVVTAGSTLTVDPNEAAGVHRIPLAEILRPGAVFRGTHVDADGSLETYILEYNGLHIWGLTGRILHAFVASYNAPDSALRAALESRLGYSRSSTRASAGRDSR